MSVDTPARIAIVGAGPVGLEAALYARFLGYDVDLYERGEVAENVMRWGHVKLFTPWRQNVSPLAIAALTAQDAHWQPPADDAVLTGREFAARYLLPLARCDLLIDGLHTRTEVVAVGREGQLKGDHVGDEARINADFRLLLRDSVGRESIAAADVVIDAGGTFGNHNWAGASGIPAPGEIAVADFIDYGLPDVLGGDRQRFAGKTTLLVGGGYSAATSIVALAELATEQAGTRTIWICRRPSEGAGPIGTFENDRLAERAFGPHRQRFGRRFVGRGRISARHSHRHHASRTGHGADVGAANRAQAGTVEVDRIIANVGYRPDARLFAELQVHQCYASDGPMKLAAALLGQASNDCLDQTSPGPATLFNPEPDFYILGSKSYGRDSRFLLSVGLDQIRDLFSIIGDRADLDLYRTFSKSQ